MNVWIQKCKIELLFEKFAKLHVVRDHVSYVPPALCALVLYLPSFLCVFVPHMSRVIRGFLSHGPCFLKSLCGRLLCTTFSRE